MIVLDSVHPEPDWKKNFLNKEKMMEIGRKRKKIRTRILLQLLRNLSSVCDVQCVPGVILWWSNLLLLVYPLCRNLSHLLLLRLEISCGSGNYNQRESEMSDWEIITHHTCPWNITFFKPALHFALLRRLSAEKKWHLSLVYTEFLALHLLAFGKKVQSEQNALKTHNVTSSSTYWWLVKSS